MSKGIGLTMNRRKFLEYFGQSSLLLGLPALSPQIGSTDTWAAPASIEIPGARPLLNSPLAQQYFVKGAGPFWVAGRFLNQFASRSANYLDYDKLDRSWRNKYTYAGAEYKSYLEARALWERVPTSIRAQGPEALQKFHQGKDWSHIIPRAMGGPTTAENGVWWSSTRNKRLGAKTMSPSQILQARAVLRFEGTLANLVLTLKPMLVGGAITVVIVTLITALDYGLQFAEGKITLDEMRERIILSAVKTGLSAGLIFGLITGLAVVVPNLLSILLVVAPALTVVSFVFLAYHVKELGEGWWIHLEEQGVLEEFLEGLVITEAIVSEMARKQSESPPLQNRRQQWAPLSSTQRLADRLSKFIAGLELRSYIPEFNYTEYFPDLDFDLDLGEFVPDFAIKEHFPALDLELLPFLRQQGLSVKDNVPRPDFDKGTEAARGALKSASAYLDSQASSSR